MKMHKMSIFRHCTARAFCLPAALAWAACLGAGAWAAVPIDGASTESHAAIRTAAENVVRSQLRGAVQTTYIHAAEPDARLHLARCPAPLTASTLAGGQLGARTEVRVSCSAPGALWAIYVPVSIESDVNVLVLREGVVRGAHVSPQQVSTETRRITGLAVGYITDMDGLQRYTLARSLPPGTALTVDVMVADYLVRQGQQVTLVAGSPGISVRASGKVLEDGREGALVRVQNLTSQKVVQGTVDADGTIQVTP